MAEVFDARPSFLGEGPLWHPLRRELFWFGEQLVYTVWAGDGPRRKGYGELWTLEADGRLGIRVTPREGASFSLVYAKRARP